MNISFFERILRGRVLLEYNILLNHTAMLQVFNQRSGNIDLFDNISPIILS